MVFLRDLELKTKKENPYDYGSVTNISLITPWHFVEKHFRTTCTISTDLNHCGHIKTIDLVLVQLLLIPPSLPYIILGNHIFGSGLMFWLVMRLDGILWMIFTNFSVLRTAQISESNYHVDFSDFSFCSFERLSRCAFVSLFYSILVSLLTYYVDWWTSECRRGHESWFLVRLLRPFQLFRTEQTSIS